MEDSSVHGSRLMQISKQGEPLTSSKFQVDTYSWRISIGRSTCGPLNAMALEKAPESTATGYFQSVTCQKHPEEDTPASVPSGVGREGRRAPSFLSGSCSLTDKLQTWATSNFHGERGSRGAWFHRFPLAPGAAAGWQWGERRLAMHACLRVSDGCGKRRQRDSNEKMEGREKEGLGERGSTTFLFSALPGDLKTPPNGSFGLFGAFGQSGRARLRRVLSLFVADARGGRGRCGLLRPGAAAGLRDAEAAAAILWGGLKLRKRLLHLVVSAAATFPARVRRRRGLRLPSSRHRAGVRSSGKLLPARSAGVGGRGDGPASLPSCSQPTHPLPPVAASPGPDPAVSPGPRSWHPNRAARPQKPLLAQAVLLPAPATQRARVGAGRGRGRRGPLRQWGRGARLRGWG